MRRAAKGFCALAVAAMVLAVSAAPSGAFRLGEWFKNGKEPDTYPYSSLRFWHWDLRQFEGCRVPWTVTNYSTQLPEADQFNAINTAFQAWEDVEPAKIGFIVTGHPTPNPVPFAKDGWNVVAWNDTVTEPDIFSIPRPIPSLTNVWYDTNTGRILDADIKFNSLYPWGVASSDQIYQTLPDRLDIRTVALHEVGHFIGLDHPVDDLGEWDNDTSPQNDFPGPGDVDRNGNGYFDGAVMRVAVDNFSRWKLAPDDKDGCNFLYNPDLGDAPDPFISTFNQYPTVVHSNIPFSTLNARPLYYPADGAEHLFGIRPRQRDRNYLYEWLGIPFGNIDDADGECDDHQVDHDAFDDGVTFSPNPAVFRKPVHIVDWMRWATDARGAGHYYQVRPLCVNTWVDFNQDGQWAIYESVIHEKRKPTPGGGRNRDFYDTAFTDVVLPDALATSKKPMWVRSRLDWNEDAGAVEDVDGTLFVARGAAQFGEVEDYPLTMQNPVRQEVPDNLSGHFASGIALVFPGASSGVQNYQSFVAGLDCPSGAFQSPPTSIYDSIVDETTVTYSHPPGIADGARVHVGRAHASSTPAQALRAYWIPQAGPPGIADRIPITNATATSRAGDEGPTTRVVVGTVNQQSGGFITGDPNAHAWGDSIYVDVTARVAPAAFSLADLNLCNPAVNALQPIHLGGGWIVPDQPFRADLGQALTTQALILEIHSSWSVNLATNMELLQLTDFGPNVGVSPPLAALERSFHLRAVPTPAVGATIVRFSLPRQSHVSLGVYDVSGALRRELLHAAPLPAGDATRFWDGHSADGRRLPAGMYFLRLEVDGQTETTQVVLLR